MPAQPSGHRRVFEGKLVSVEVWEGRQREIVRHPGSCAVVALTPEGDVVLVRQHRDAVGVRLLEVPAGTQDREGERPEECAARELEEEAGYRPTTPLKRMTSILPSPGFLDERVEIFRCEAEPTGADPEEGLEVVLMGLRDAVNAVRDGRIKDAKSAIGLLLAAHT